MKLDNIANSMRVIVFGTYELLKDVLGLDSNETKLASFKEVKPHPEVDIDVFHSTNPDLLVVIDQASKIRGQGMNNCVVCKGFRANEVCPIILEKFEKEEILDQDAVSYFSIGNCVLFDQLDNIDYDKILDVVYDNQIVIQKSDKIRTLGKDDLHGTP